MAKNRAATATSEVPARSDNATAPAPRGATHCRERQRERCGHSAAQAACPASAQGTACCAASGSAQRQLESLFLQLAQRARGDGAARSAHRAGAQQRRDDRKLHLSALGERHLRRNAASEMAMTRPASASQGSPPRGPSSTTRRASVRPAGFVCRLVRSPHATRHPFPRRSSRARQRPWSLSQRYWRRV